MREEFCVENCKVFKLYFTCRQMAGSCSKGGKWKENMQEIEQKNILLFKVIGIVKLHYTSGLTHISLVVAEENISSLLEWDIILGMVIRVTPGH